MARLFFSLCLLFILSACASPTKVFVNSDSNLNSLYGSTKNNVQNRQKALKGNYSTRRFAVVQGIDNVAHGSWVQFSDPSGVSYMDVGIEFKRADSIVYYRIDIRPLKMEQSIIDQWPEHINLMIGKNKREQRVLVAQLPKNRAINSGYLTTDWTLCTQCMGLTNSGNKGTFSHQKKAYSFFDSLSKKSANLLAYSYIEFKDKPRYGSITGQAAITTAEVWGDEIAQKTRALAAEKKRLKPARAAYNKFMSRYKRNTPLGRLKSQCGEFGTPGTDYAESSRKIISRIQFQNDRFEKINECSNQFFAAYDFAERHESLDSINATKNVLENAAEIKASKRKTIVIEDEVNELVQFVAQQNKNYQYFMQDIEKVLKSQQRHEKIDANNRRYAQQANINFMNRMASINNEIRDIGRKNREIMANINEMKQDAIQQKIKQSRKQQKIPSVAKPSTQTVIKPTPKLQAKTRKIGNNQTKKQPSLEKPIVQSKMSNVVRITGGMTSCVSVLEKKFHKASSPHSSCPYSDGERKSLIIKFANNCGVPVNVTQVLAIDDGTQKETTEYNVKPNKTRWTVGHCGATDFNFSFEETLESFSKRNAN